MFFALRTKACLSIALACCLFAPRAAGVRAAIREDGTLIVDGEVVFPIGIRIEGDGSEHALIAETGFNMLLGSGAVEPSYYDRANEHGLLVIAGHYVWATFASFRKGNSRGIDLYAEEGAGLEKAFRYTNQSRQTPLQAMAAVDHHPCVFAWNTCEEPGAKFIEPLEFMYEIVKSNSPGHLVIPLSCDVDWFHTFRNAGDVLMMDVYPYRGSKKSQPPAYSHDRIKLAREALPGKAVWLMPQLYHPSYWSRQAGDDLTLQQMRQADYLGLIAGAKGIMMYSHSSYRTWWKDGERVRNIREHPPPAEVWETRWGRLRRLVAELKQLGPVICDGRPVDLPLYWRITGEQGGSAGPVFVRTLDLYGELYVLVANLCGSDVAADLNWTSRVNRHAFDTSVFLGQENLSLTVAGEGRAPTVLGVKPQGCGVFRLTRRPLKPKK